MIQQNHNVSIEYNMSRQHQSIELPVYQRPVFDSIVSLTTSLRRQFIKYMLTTLSNPLLSFVAKDSHIFQQK